jgi:hypothetical protein
VANGGTGLTSGTSGGIPAYTGSTTVTSSAVLTQYGVVYGGGTGATPAATAAGSANQVLTSQGGSGMPIWVPVGSTNCATPVKLSGALSLTLSTTKKITTLTIPTAGTWSIYGFVGINTSDSTGEIYAFSTTTDYDGTSTVPSTDTTAVMDSNGNFTNRDDINIAGHIVVLSIGPSAITVAGSTVLYLETQVLGSGVSTLQGFGSLCSQRLY